MMKDVAFLENDYKQKKVMDGLKYGNLGKEGATKFLNVAEHLNEQKCSNINIQMKSLYDSVPVKIISEFFTKNDVAKNIFKNAKDFEKVAYSRSFVSPNKLGNELISIISVILDYFGIERRTFFNIFTEQGFLNFK